MVLKYRFNSISLKDGKVSRTSKPVVFRSREEAIAAVNRLMSFMHVAGYEVVESRTDKSGTVFDTFYLIIDSSHDERLIGGSLEYMRPTVWKNLKELRERYGIASQKAA